MLYSSQLASGVCIAALLNFFCNSVNGLHISTTSGNILRKTMFLKESKKEGYWKQMESHRWELLSY